MGKKIKKKKKKKKECKNILINLIFQDLYKNWWGQLSELFSY